MALSKNKIKFVQSLKDKKHRTEHGVFVAEGLKLVLDLVESAECLFIAALPEVRAELGNLNGIEFIEAGEDELKKASLLKTPPRIIGVFNQFDDSFAEVSISDKLSLVLDGVQDPGNMGTIIRLADWFGIEHVFCSHDTADIYNPKTVQSTMGAIARVRTYYTDVGELLSRYSALPVYGTFLNGANIYNEQLSENGFIVMGSEGRGISPEIEQQINHRLFIPNYPATRKTSESLNVATATGIVLSEFRRRG